MPDLPQDAQFGQLLLQRFREMMQGPDAPQPDPHQIIPQTPLTMESDPYHLANHPILNAILPHLQRLFSDPSSVLGVAGAVEVPEAAAAKSLVGQGKTYFSNVLDAFSNPKVPNKLTRDQALSVLKAPGVKAEENKWLGMEDFLRGKDRWTKDEIAQYVRDHQIDVHQISSLPPRPQELDNIASWAKKAGYTSIDPTIPTWRDPQGNLIGHGQVIDAHAQALREWEKIRQEGLEAQYSNYTLPGGSNYREHLLTFGNAPHYGEEEFQSGHFEEPNILAHFRTTDRLTPDGKKVLMVEEIQSDWQKALRKQDVAQQPPTQTWDYRASKILHDKGLGEYAPLGKETLGLLENPAARSTPSSKIPEAPLARDYLNLATKRIARMAAEEGYDAVGFTTGAQQARRYNQSLLNNVDRLDYNPYSQDLDIWKGGEKIHTMQVPVTKLAETVGQDQAEKLLQGLSKRSISLVDNKTGEVIRRGIPSEEEAYDLVESGKVKSSGYGFRLQKNEPSASISGQDMRIGARGHSQVYDEQIPRLMDKLGKQFGARTQEGQVIGQNKSLKSQEGWSWDSPYRDGFKTWRDSSFRHGERGGWDDEVGQNFSEERLHEMYENLFSHKGPKPPRDIPYDAHLFPLTPTLRESAKSKGFPLFELGAGALGAGLASQWQRDKDANYVLH